MRNDRPHHVGLRRQMEKKFAGKIISAARLEEALRITRFSREYMRTFLANSEYFCEHSPHHVKFLLRIARGKYILINDYVKP